ncbi:sterol desaturase family protein [Limnohabitans sp. 15K]|jgi:sterol desaturase/sphingolipid hydroxylase (fatty acid hydroxylase superfamily)|uniref:sterol desaturase family protein n=1 Tax=Limnohabitans sp. 15K TaxID=1100706 RepID=UPI000C1F0A81|nr:sterol desaturase family protein [Limnohabitans sp. 15K]PIT82928.1 fatty acid hydroxylase [Limnohabitans sp. 15K]
MTPSQIQNALVLCIILGFAMMEWASRRYKNTVNATGNDTALELLMFLSVLAVTQPLAIFVTSKLGTAWFPEYKGILADMPWWGMVGVLLVLDDMTQYWWHRLSHTSFLWPLHRAHHSAEYMSIRVTFRNNFFYYLMMPGLWFAGALLYLGFGGMVYAGYIVVKLFVILGAHSAWRWDEPLYRIRALKPVMWVLERTISTPATHWAHHAITNADGVGHYKGNFGNLLFLWDIIFGSAHITRRYPEQVGLIDDKLFGQERWYHQMWYPLLQSQREHTALKFGGRVYEGPEGHPPQA